MCKNKIRHNKKTFLLSILGLIITLCIILYPYRVNAQNNDWLSGIKNTLEGLIEQLKQVRTSPSPNNPTVVNVSNGNLLSIEPGKVHSTNEILYKQPLVNLSCNSVEGCQLKLKILRKEVSPDNYSFYKEIKVEEVKLNEKQSTRLIITGYKGPYIINISNLSDKAVLIEYKVQEMEQSVPSPSNTPTLPSNLIQNNLTDLGRIKFHQVENDSYVFLVTQKLNKGKYKFNIIPAPKRKRLSFIPLEHGISLNISLLNTNKTIQQLYTTEEVIHINNPLVNTKGIIVVEVEVKQDNSQICIIGI